MMAEPGFRASLKKTESFPWYDRAILNGLTQFVSDKDGFTVFVTSQAVRDLKEGTANHAPNEAFGQLMGRVYKDDYGYIVVVSGAVYARHLTASAGFVKLTAEEMRNLRLEASRRYPATDFIGWTHSHTQYSRYSTTDQIEQTTWTEDHNIGILTFMEVDQGKPWASAYCGPASLPLSLNAPPTLKGISAEPTVIYEEQVHDASTGGSASQVSPVPLVRQRRSWRYVNWSSITSVVLALLLIFSMVLIWLDLHSSLRNLDNELRGLQEQLTTQRATSPVVSAVSNFPWTCNREEGVAPLKVSCYGPVGQIITAWTWDFGDKTSFLHMNTISHTYKYAGSYRLSLTITTISGGDQSVGYLDITVTNPF